MPILEIVNPGSCYHGTAMRELISARLYSLTYTTLPLLKVHISARLDPIDLSPDFDFSFRNHTSQSMILTPDRLAKLASTPLLANSWYFVAAATVSVCNQPDEIPRIFEFMMDRLKNEDTTTQFQMVQKMRDALLKCGALGGLPKTINALTVLKNSTPNHLRETQVHRVSSPTSVDSENTRGASFFDAVYGKISKRVYNQMYSAYPDLGEYAINHVYAPLLSYTNVLSPKETSLVVIACLIPQDVNPQLKGHLKGALNNGATKQEIESLRQMSITICNWCGVQWRSEVAKL